MPHNDSGAAPEQGDPANESAPARDIDSASIVREAERLHRAELAEHYGSADPDDWRTFDRPGTPEWDAMVAAHVYNLTWKAEEAAAVPPAWSAAMEPADRLPTTDEARVDQDGLSGQPFVVDANGATWPLDRRVELLIRGHKGAARDRHLAGDHASATEQGCEHCWVRAERHNNPMGTRGLTHTALLAGGGTAAVEARWRAHLLTGRRVAESREIHAPVDPATGQPSGDSWANRADDVEAALAGTGEPELPSLFYRSDEHFLLYPGRTHSISGESESGKSLTSLIPAAEALTAGERVLILDGESDAATVVGRLLALGVPADMLRGGLTYVRPDGPPEASANSLASWEALLATRYELVLIDGVTEFLARWGVDSIDNDAVTRWYRDVPHRLAESTGAAVVLIDHVTKSADGRGRFAIGAQAKLASLSGAAYLLEVVEPIGIGMLGRLALRVAKDRPGGVRPHCGAYRASDRTQEAAVITIDSRESGRTVATVDPPRGGAGGELATFRPTVLMERVSRLLEAGGPTSRRGITSAVTGKATAIRTAVDVLIAEGFAADDGPALHGHPSIRLLKPFRDTPDGTS